MFNSGDKAYLQQLNNQLVNAISKTSTDISDASVQRLSISLSNAIVNAIKSASPPPPIPPGGGPGSPSGSAPVDATLKKGEIILTFKQIARALDNLVGMFNDAANGVFKFGASLSRVSVATNTLGLVGLKSIDMTKSLDFSSPAVDTSFGKFGFDLGETGDMLATALKSNVKAISSNSQIFLARSVGLGTELGTTIEFLATNTQALGYNQDATVQLGHSILESSKQTGVFADTVFKAVKSFEQSTKQQAVIYGKGLSQDMQRFVAGLTKEMGFQSPDLIGLVSKLTPTSAEDIASTRALAARLGVDVGKMGKNQEEFVSEMLVALSRRAEGIRAGSGDDALATAARMTAELQGISLEQIQAAGVAVAKLGTAGDIVRKSKLQPAPTGNELSRTIEEESNAIRSLNKDAAENAKNFALSLAGTSTAFEMLEATQSAFDAALYDATTSLTNFAHVVGNVGVGTAGAFKLAGTVAPGVADSFTNILETTLGMKLAGVKLGDLRSKISTRYPAAGAAITNFPTHFDPKYMDMATTPGATVSTRLSAAARNKFNLFTKPTAGGVALGALGGVITGASDYAEHGDISHAASTGLGGALGGYGGATLGAAIGTAILPGIGTVVGGLLGGALGGWGGSEAGGAIDEALWSPEIKQANMDTGAKVSKAQESDQQKLDGDRQQDVVGKQLDVARSHTEYFASMDESLAILAGRTQSVASATIKPPKDDSRRDAEFVFSTGSSEYSMRQQLAYNTERA